MSIETGRPAASDSRPHGTGQPTPTNAADATQGPTAREGGSPSAATSQGTPAQTPDQSTPPPGDARTPAAPAGEQTNGASATTSAAHPPADGARPTTGQSAAGQPAKLAVPERPRLAPGVRLAGQMQESAFKEPPWLIEREGAGYVQLTELLYRIAERCDGRHTLAEIARDVSAATGRTVSAENVRLLVGTQLILKGLVPAADGRVVGAPSAGRSLLALSLKTKTIGPERLDAPTRLLRWLFWPPVLLTVLGLTVFGVGWLLLAHGLAAGARDALYQPVLLLGLLALTALAAGVHELGHAAALRYGGGRPNGMGVGLYLVYPAFYTDVSDNYRLPRWSRVRTDLGGIYFHLVVVLAVLGSYLLTGWEPLLVAVPLLLLDAGRQLLPLLRLDGYWTLADLTGIPDFFTYLSALVRRLRPGDGDPPPALPALKWWGKAVFGLYVAIVLPLLAFMLFTMLRTTPTILATAWDSAGQQAAGFQQARAAGDAAGMTLAVVQVAVLALPTLGLVYSLGRFGTRIVRAGWRWSSPTPARRAIGGLGTVAALGLVAYLWAPQLPFGRGESGPLYAPTVASFAPIPADTRGTVFDTLGVEPPAWAPAAAEPTVRPDAAASPVPAAGASPAPVGAPASPAPAGGGASPGPLAAPAGPAASGPATVAPTPAPAAPGPTARPTVRPAAAPTTAPTPGAPATAPVPADVAATVPAAPTAPGLAPPALTRAPALAAPATAVATPAPPRTPTRPPAGATPTPVVTPARP